MVHVGTLDRESLGVLGTPSSGGYRYYMALLVYARDVRQVVRVMTETMILRFFLCVAARVARGPLYDQAMTILPSCFFLLTFCVAAAQVLLMSCGWMGV